MTDPIIEAAHRVTGDAFDVLRRVVDGLPAEALNWRPAGDQTNSIAVLTTHAMQSTRFLVRMAVGLPELSRDRSAEFTATADDPASLLQLIEDLAADCAAALDSAGPVDWGELRQRTRDDGEVVETSASYYLIHAVEHLRGHADEASLTRHMWTARS